MDVGVEMDISKYCSGHGSGQNNFKSNVLGYSLIEFLVFLTVISVIAINLVPSLYALLAKERNTILINNIVSALVYARTASIMKQTDIITCQSNNSIDCNNSENWHKGWIIFTDMNGNKQRDPQEKLLRVFTGGNNGSRAIFKGSRGIKYYIKYKPTGRAYPNGSFLICNPEIGTGKALIMANTGRLRLSEKQTNGSAVTCH